MANAGLLRFIAVLLGFLAVLFLLIAVPTHHWYVGYRHANATANETAEIYGGIFEDCYYNIDSGSYTCASSGGGYITSTKVFMILGIVGYALSLAYLLAMAFTRGINFKVLGGLVVLTGFFILIGLGIYTNKHNVHDAKTWMFSWSFALGWTSCVFTFIAGVLSFFCEAKYEQI